MNKKQYTAPVCEVTEIDAHTMLASSPVTYDIDVDNIAAEEIIYGDVNRNSFEDIAW